MSHQKPSDFVHLHLHTVYSLLDGAIRIDDLMHTVKRLGMDSVAMTDHGNMYGTVEFYESALKNGIKPIIGEEFYVAPGSHLSKTNAEGVRDGKAYHLIVLAKNKKGYKNLIKLSSRAFLDGFYHKPRIDYELLQNHSEGLVVTSACIAGEVNRNLVTGKEKEARDLAGHLNEIMGKGNFYLEIQKHGIKEQEIAARGSVEISKKLGIPLVLANDAHFLNREDKEAQEILLRIQMNKKINDPLDFGFNEEFYVKSAQEMSLLFPDLPEALYATREIADKIDLELDFGSPHLPDFVVPGGMSLKEYLIKLSHEGLRKKFPDEVPDKYKKRLNYELDVINTMGFEGYFLIVQDFIGFARSQRIPVGPGRGSAAGSLVAYSLGITNLDPIRYGLLFERFLNPDRHEMPDIDIDFCRDRREEVYDYVVQKYGDDHVSQIITFGTMSAKAVTKDVARVLGIEFEKINQITKMMPGTPGIELDDAVAALPAEGRKLFQEEKRLYKISKALEKFPRNPGKHAAGVVIAPEKLDEIIPLARDSRTGSVISQFEKISLEKAGLVKMDFLGLKNLTIIQMAVDEINRRHNIDLDITRIPLDDPAAFQLLREGKTKGVFQLESRGITQLTMRSKPERFEDIIALIALYRPGPLESGMAEDYVKRKTGEEKVVYPHENLKPVLRETFGTIIYQEQIMQISQVIGGFKMPEADKLRKAMGKKLPEVMAKMKTLFLEGARTNGYEAKFASDLFDNMEKFGHYGFNKSHSAAYGLICYQTSYLKAHYPVEFLKANLDADIEDTDKLIGFIYSAKEMGIKILPPDINESNEYFTVIDEKTIRYGLLGLKNMGHPAVHSIIGTRKEKGIFKSLDDFVRKADYKYFNKKMLESLVLSGALDSFGYTRSSVFGSVDTILDWKRRKNQDELTGQESLFSIAVHADMEEKIPLTPEEEWKDSEKLKMEKDVLGLYLTSHPMMKYKNLLSQTKITALEDIDDGISLEKDATIAGVIESVRNVSGGKKPFYEIEISDLTSRTKVRIYEKLFQENADKLSENKIVMLDVSIIIHRDSDQASVFIFGKKIMPVSELKKQIKQSLHIFIPSQSRNDLMSKINNIQKILKAYHGENPVFLHYQLQGHSIEVIKAHPSFFVDGRKEISRDLSAVLSSESHIVWKSLDGLSQTGNGVLS